MKALVNFVVCSVVLDVVGTAAAAPTPPPITNNDYAIDVFQGPVTTAARVVGDAGAYTALAEACEGEYSNAAAPGVRAPWSYARWDYDVCLDFTNPGAFGNVDVENRGVGYTNDPNRYRNAFTIAPGLELQYKSLGITMLGNQTRFGIGGGSVFSTPFSVVLNQITTSIANAFANDQLVLGFGLKVALLSVDQKVGATDETLISSSGFGFQVGAVFKPNRLPFRLGGAFRSQITVADIPGTLVTSDGARAVGSASHPFLVPDRVELPWELEVGGAVELGSRPLNRSRADATFVEDQLRGEVDRRKLDRAEASARMLATLPQAAKEAARRELEAKEDALEQSEAAKLDGEIDDLRKAQRAEYDLWSRGEVLLLATVLITGNTVKGVDVADALAQVRVPAGTSVAVSPRLALETELVPRWFTARGGVYLEPARLRGSDARGHATIGADVRLFKFNPFGLFGDDPWRIRIANDFAPRYFNYGVSLGKYH